MEEAAVEVVPADDVAVEDGAADQAADGAAEDTGGNQVILAGRRLCRQSAQVRDCEQAGIEPFTMSFVEISHGFHQLRRDDALAGPAVHKGDVVGGMTSENAAEGN